MTLVACDEIGCILQKRFQKGSLEYLVKWRTFDHDWNTWTSVSDLENCGRAIAEFNDRLDLFAEIESKLIGIELRSTSIGRLSASVSHATVPGLTLRPLERMLDTIGKETSSLRTYTKSIRHAMFPDVTTCDEPRPIMTRKRTRELAHPASTATIMHPRPPNKRQDRTAAIRKRTRELVHPPSRVQERMATRNCSPPTKVQEQTARKSTQSVKGKTAKDVYDVDYIVEKRVHDGSLQYLVKWKNFNRDWNTWEPMSHLDNCARAITEFDANGRTPSN
jgi:hypothetical protein